MGRDLCPVWAMIARSDDVRHRRRGGQPRPQRVPRVVPGSSPAALAQRFTTSATDWSVSLVSATLPWRSTGRKIGPRAMTATSSQARSAGAEDYRAVAREVLSRVPQEVRA